MNVVTSAALSVMLPSASMSEKTSLTVSSSFCERICNFNKCSQRLPVYPHGLIHPRIHHTAPLVGPQHCDCCSEVKTAFELARRSQKGILVNPRHHRSESTLMPPHPGLD